MSDQADSDLQAEFCFTVEHHWKKGVTVSLPHQCGAWDVNNEDAYTGEIRWVSVEEAINNLGTFILSAVDAYTSLIRSTRNEI